MTQMASSMYNKARNISAGKIDLEISWSTIGIITLLGIVYLVISSIGLNIYASCDAMKDKPVQENLNKYLAATLTIGLTIPFTLLVTKFVKNETMAFMMIYSIMGIVGSAAVLNWTMTCEKAKQSDKGFAGFSLASFICVFIATAFMMRPKKSY
jgi:uncharacterized membrane protein YuzA (DUF378 family)